jgi:hypothetical protein
VSPTGSAFRDRQRPKTDTVRKPQNALLAGLLVCNHCDRPMVATYSAKGARRYRYYVCQAARQNGWQSCPTKSVSAALIEDSVVTQLRDQMRLDKTRAQLQIPDSDLDVLLAGDPDALVHPLVEKIRYDGTTGTVAMTLRARGISNVEVQP